MKTIVIHLPSEEEQIRRQLKRRVTIEDVVAEFDRHRIREFFGATENTITLEIP